MRENKWVIAFCSIPPSHCSNIILQQYYSISTGSSSIGMVSWDDKGTTITSQSKKLEDVLILVTEVTAIREP